MWNSPNKPISPRDIDTEYMRVLEDAVYDCQQDYPLRKADIYEALKHFEKRTIRSHGFNVYKHGLEIWCPKTLNDGLRKIKEHVGYKIIR